MGWRGLLMTMPEPIFTEDAWSFQATWTEWVQQECGEAKVLVTGTKLTGQLSLIVSPRDHSDQPWTSAVLTDHTGQATMSMGHFQAWVLAELKDLHEEQLRRPLHG
jgi:hypothetical protein